jgi:predicted permease
MKRHLWRAALLRLFPAGFRQEYAAEIAAVDELQHSPALLAASGMVANAAAAHFDILRQDLRLAARSLRRAPGFAAGVILAMALGIGANTAVFSLVYHVLLGPLPYPHSRQLVTIQESEPGPGFGRNTNQLDPSDYRDWTLAGSDFAALGAWTSQPLNLTGQGTPQRLEGVLATASLLPLLGVSPARGRRFTPADDRPGAPNTVILSDALWRQLGADPDLIGRALTLDNQAYTVIGVMPAGYAFPNPSIQIWTPFRLSPADTDRSNTYLNVVGRLRPGVTLAAAQAQLQAEAARLAKIYPNDLTGITAYIQPLAGQAPPQRRVMLWALLGGALCVLLVACLNLANLMFARLLSRRAEFSTRAALGAGRERLLRQLLTETLLLAALGGAAGIGLAALLLPVLAQFTPADLPIAAAPTLSLPVLLAACGLTLFSGLLFGILPAARWARSLAPSSSRGAVAASGRLRPALVIAEVAGCMLLVTICGLLLRALQSVANAPTGFDATHVLTLRTALPLPKYAQLTAREHYFDSVLDAVRALPGTQAAGFTSFLPLRNFGGFWPVAMPGSAGVTRSQQPEAVLRLLTPGYFAALKIPLLQGRDFTRADQAASLPVVIVSQDFARRFWPGRDPSGQQFRLAGAQRTVVGVAGSVKMRGLERHIEPQVYLPYTQAGEVAPVYTPKDLAVRSTLSPDALAKALRGIIGQTDPDQPITSLEPMEAIASAELGPRQQQLGILGSFGLLALLLAGLGVYGVLAFNVAARGPELSLRMALGARPAELLRQVLRASLALAAAGIACGLLLAWLAERALPALLGVVPTGAYGAWIAAACVCALMTLAGALLPACRAARTDPATLLRA